MLKWIYRSSMDGKRENDGVNPIKYIQKGFWVWFGFLGAVLSVIVGVFILYLLAGFIFSVYTYIFSAYTYISTKPQRDWEECWENENTAYFKRWEELASLKSRNIKYPEYLTKREVLIFSKEGQRIGDNLKLPSVICREKGYKQFGVSGWAKFKPSADWHTI